MKKQYILSILASSMVIAITGCSNTTSSQPTQQSVNTISHQTHQISSQNTTSTNQTPTNSNNQLIIPTLTVSFGQDQSSNLSFKNMPNNYSVHEILINYLDPTDSKVPYKDDCLFINGKWVADNGSTPIIVNSDGSYGLDFPNGYIGNDAQVFVTFQTPSGQMIEAQSGIFNTQTLKMK